MSKAIKKEDIEVLFKKFSHPLLKLAITPHQKQVALGLSKILWLLFITNNDTEENTYNMLDQVLKNHESNISYHFSLDCA